jgi:predicted dehydrogenase
MSGIPEGYSVGLVSDPVRVGLLGAGPWASAVTGPVFAAGPETTLAGVWSRTPASARAAGDRLRVDVFEDVDALLERCDAVAIAVVPDAQPELAIHAAQRGKALLLEKPLAADIDGARALVDGVGETGVPTMLMLTYRFHPGLPAFADAAARFDALGGWGCFLSGAFLPESPYARGWRLERGALLDVGPHLLDLHEIALGEIVDVTARGDVHGWIALTLTHASGATSQASLCCRAAMESRTEVEVFGPAGQLRFDGRAGDPRSIGDNIRRAFAAVARGERHDSDVARGWHLQQLVDRAERQLLAE